MQIKIFTTTLCNLLFQSKMYNQLQCYCMVSRMSVGKRTNNCFVIISKFFSHIERAHGFLCINQRTNGPVNAHLRSAVYTNVTDNSPSIGADEALGPFSFQNNILSIQVFPFK